jgi:lipopolysaccharide/colanic/teichoic acid biosynthesis glycosyltransferase
MMRSLDEEGPMEKSGPVLEHATAALCLKRILDLLVAGSLLFMLWPLLVAISIVIKVSSRGPVLYRGIRSGRRGMTFRILKFRTMVEAAESLGGVTTGTNDPRVTPLGKLLRRTKLDELPQLWNVLWGDMSLVGPRPEVLEYTSRYTGDEILILQMRPGITDYASIEFADLDDLVGCDDPDAFFRERILPRKNQLRVKYVREWSLGGDLALLWRTMCRVVGRAVGR